MIALRTCFAYVISEGGWASRQRHSYMLTRRLFEGMCALRHSATSGLAICEVYGRHEEQRRIEKEWIDANDFTGDMKMIADTLPLNFMIQGKQGLL